MPSLPSGTFAWRYKEKSAFQKLDGHIVRRRGLAPLQLDWEHPQGNCVIAEPRHSRAVPSGCFRCTRSGGQRRERSKTTGDMCRRARNPPSEDVQTLWSSLFTHQVEVQAAAWGRVPFQENRCTPGPPISDRRSFSNTRHRRPGCFTGGLTFAETPLVGRQFAVRIIRRPAEQLERPLGANSGGSINGQA